MPAVSFNMCMTTGHDSYPPTQVPATQSKLFVQGQAVLKNSDEALNHGHKNPGKCIASQSKLFVQGQAVIMIGDRLDDDDYTAQGSSKLFVK